MALPALPENNTDRLFIHYTTGGGATAQNHVLSIRYNAQLSTPQDIMEGLAGAITSTGGTAGLFDGWSVLRAEVQAEGAQVRLPVSVPASLLAVEGTGQASATPTEQAREVRFIGRGLTTGRRVSFSLFGVATPAIVEPDFRFEPGPGTFLGNVLNHATGIGLTGGAYTNIGKGPTNWYPYVNWQYNSHWETEQRA